MLIEQIELMETAPGESRQIRGKRVCRTDSGSWLVNDIRCDYLPYALAEVLHDTNNNGGTKYPKD